MPLSPRPSGVGAQFAGPNHVNVASPLMTVAAPDDGVSRDAAPDRAGFHQRPFRASPYQQAYLEAWLDPQAPKTISGIARHIDVPRRTIHSWLAIDDFVRWFNGEIERHTCALWRPVLLKVTELALQGSIEHIKLLAQIRGAIRNERDDVVAGDVRVLFGIRRT